MQQVGDSAKTIKIAGGGIAGLTAAIQLKKVGLDPIVFEKETEIGRNRHGDYEGLENWIFDSSMSEFFSQSGFDFSQVTSIPVNQFRVHTATTPSFMIHHHQPFFHMVRRGSIATDLDTELYRQCQSTGVHIKQGVKAHKNCDIYATGTAQELAELQRLLKRQYKVGSRESASEEGGFLYRGIRVRIIKGRVITDMDEYVER